MRPLLLAGGVLFASLAVPAQDRPPARPIRVEANYIRVDLYPTQDGRPIADLDAQEVEILDQGVPQRIERFEHILLRGTGPPPDTAGPVTVAEARAPAPDARARLFVLFLDTNHVDSNWTRGISRVLTRALDTLIQGDDLIAVMTPAMRPRDLTFTRRTAGIEQVLRTVWGSRDRWVVLNPEEAEYMNCYPERGSGVAQEMILRRREQQSVDALDALVEHLGTLRDARKAVITISNGWRLFADDGILEPQSAPEPPGVDPRGGRLTIGQRASRRDATAIAAPSANCDSTSDSARCSTLPTGRTRPSIRSIPAV